MLSIYICEDQKEQREQIKRIIEESILLLRYPMEIVSVTDKPKYLMADLRKEKKQGLYFLDIDLNAAYNGFELAKQIREYDQDGYFVFVTSHSDLAVLTYEYEIDTMDYIVKSDPLSFRSKLVRSLKKAERRINEQQVEKAKRFVLQLKDKVIVEEIDHIVAFTTVPNSHKITMLTFTKTLQFYSTLTYVQENLNQNFYRCSDSTIINKKHIESVDKKSRIITMKDGSEYEASVRRIKGVCV